MVGVGVSIEDGVHASEFFTDSLGAEIGRGIDEDHMTGILNRNRGPRTIVMPIRRSADLATATQRGNAHGGAAA